MNCHSVSENNKKERASKEKRSGKKTEGSTERNHEITKEGKHEKGSTKKNKDHQEKAKYRNRPIEISLM